MRLDLFLKVSRLVSSRNIAQELCDLGLVAVNGSAAKPAKELKVGDTVMIERRGRRMEVKVTEIPVKKQVSKAEAPQLYSVVYEDRSRPEDLLS